MKPIRIAALLSVCTALAARAGQLITESPLPAGTQATVLSAGPGGMWFGERGSRVGVITPEGRVTEFPVSAPAIGIAAGADGNVWFTSPGRLSRITPGGVLTEFPAPPRPGGLIAGRDGNLWFPASTEARGNVLCRATTEGRITEIPLGEDAGFRIAEGTDGDFWLTGDETFGAGYLLRVTASGAVTKTSLGGFPGGLSVAPDGNVWVALLTPGYAARLTPAGHLDYFSAPVAGGIVHGRDGRVWFTATGGRIGRMASNGTYTLLPVPAASAYPAEIAAASDGSLWFSEALGGRIGRVEVEPESQELSLDDGRFRVELAWTSATGSGLGHPVRLSPSAGYFWFDDPGNVEVMVKLLDWCPDDVLFFAAGLTTFGTTLTVTNTATGASRVWAQTAGSPFEPVQERLGTCTSSTSIAGWWTGTFDARDPFDCLPGAPAQAFLQSDGASVRGAVSVGGVCGWGDVVFTGTLSGGSVTGTVDGGPFTRPRDVRGTFGDGTLQLDIASIGCCDFNAGTMRLRR